MAKTEVLKFGRWHLKLVWTKTGPLYHTSGDPARVGVENGDRERAAAALAAHLRITHDETYAVLWDPLVRSD